MEQVTLRKATFKVNYINTDQWINTDRYGKKYWKNCFVDPSGEIIPFTEEWHHIEEALEIIKNIDESRKSTIGFVKRNIAAWKHELKRDSSDKYYQERLKQSEKDLEDCPQPIMMDTFKAVNFNKGYDAGEFLVIYCGYVAISDFHPMYHKVSHKQAEVLNCYLEDGVLIPMAVKDIKYRDRRKELKDEVTSILQRMVYYSDTTNAFHCPSGFPRMGWKTAKAHFENNELPKLNSKKFKEELAKYNLQIPEYKVNYSWSGKSLKIDESTFNLK